MLRWLLSYKLRRSTTLACKQKTTSMTGYASLRSQNVMIVERSRHFQTMLRGVTFTLQHRTLWLKNRNITTLQTKWSSLLIQSTPIRFCAMLSVLFEHTWRSATALQSQFSSNSVVLYYIKRPSLFCFSHCHIQNPQWKRHCNTQNLVLRRRFVTVCERKCLNLVCCHSIALHCSLYRVSERQSRIFDLTLDFGVPKVETEFYFHM